MKLLKTASGVVVAAMMQMFVAAPGYALAPAWKIVPDRSSLTFAATQNGAPVKGQFKKFDGEINFDFNQLKDNKVKIIVDMNSLTTSYADLTSTLKTPDWFDMKIFPEAVFEASQFEKTGTNQYAAKGTLTIRDKSVPIDMTFTADQSSANSAIIKGSTTLRRTAFGVGQGEWASVSEIKDDVKVDFVVNATK
jgi:polyisoprenoid-binding protein YceI